MTLVTASSSQKACHTDLTHSLWSLLTKEIISSTTLEEMTTLFWFSFVKRDDLFDKGEAEESSKRRSLRRLFWDLFDDSFDKRDHVFDDSFDKRDVKEIVFYTTLLRLCQKTSVCVSRTFFGLFWQKETCNLVKRDCHVARTLKRDWQRDWPSC